MNNKNTLLKGLLIIGILVVFFISCSEKKNDAKNYKFDKKNNNTNKQYNRIISLAPSITEIVFASGFGDKLIGISSYSNYPKEQTEKIQKVGSYLDTNLELIVKLNPDLVLLLPSSTKAKVDLEKLGIETFTLDNRTIKAIVNSFYVLDEKIRRKNLGNEKVNRAIFVADSLTNEMNEIIFNFSHKNNIDSLKVLISAGRDFSQEITSVYAVGENTFLDNIITSLGFVNVLAGYNSKVKYPKISVEGLISLNPDLVIELVSDLNKTGVPVESLTSHWNKIFDLMPKNSDGKLKKVIIIPGNYSSIPGPRIIKLYREIVKAF